MIEIQRCLHTFQIVTTLQYTCDQNCTSYGPYFGGLSDEACKAHGGTFCPVSNCTDLQVCVEDYHDEAVNDKKTAFANYLESMPGGEYLSCDTDKSCEKWDPIDPFACGRAREYFGFDTNFINDKQICEDISQFRNTRDFQFLEEFFKQGSDGSFSPENTEPPLVPPLVLKLPTAGKCMYAFGNGKKLLRCRLAHICFPLLFFNCIDDPKNKEEGSKAPEVQNGQAWRATNFALSKVVAIFASAADSVRSTKCVCEVVCPLANPCAVLSTILGLSVEVIKFAIDLVRPPDCCYRHCAANYALNTFFVPPFADS
jgi:hypothetical protein